MPGVIDALAAETTELRRAERARVARETAEANARRVVEEREQTAKARVLAMEAAKSLTGRVIFPARWAVVPVEQAHRRCLRETIEGKVTIWVYVNGIYVERILVGNDEKGKMIEWKQPRIQSAVSRWPVGPGRDWFRRALVDLGVIA